LIQNLLYRIGTAGWSVPTKQKEEGSHLHRYSRTLSCVEINSTFYRTHRSATWAKWAAETPADFRFSIKAPKSITHEAKLHNSEPILRRFFEQIQPVREKLGPILFQLPPALAFDSVLAEDFFAMLRALYDKELVLEPRHATWFTSSVNVLLKKHMITRVAADPPKAAAEAAEPGGDHRLTYYRLHGYPRIYYSNYNDDFLATLAAKVKKHKNAWIIFDNTALSHAYSNAILLKTLVAHSDTRVKVEQASFSVS
jgi:uncharacterized protein YecE (DUF72 family)